MNTTYREGARQSAGCSQELLQYLYFLRYYCLKLCKFFLQTRVHNVESSDVIIFFPQHCLVISQNLFWNCSCMTAPSMVTRSHCTGWPWISGCPVRGNLAGLLRPLFTWASTDPYHVNNACTEFVMHMYNLNTIVIVISLLWYVCTMVILDQCLHLIPVYCRCIKMLQ